MQIIITIAVQFHPFVRPNEIPDRVERPPTLNYHDIYTICMLATPFITAP